MNTTTKQLINGIVIEKLISNGTIIDGLEEYYHLESLIVEKFEEKENETEEDAIKRAESILNRLREVIGIIDSLNEMGGSINGIVVNTEEEIKKLKERNNELIDIIIDLEQRRILKLIEQNPKRINEFKGMFEDKKVELNEFRMNLKETQQLEEWTGMKIGNIVFDSDIDNWKEVTSVFDQKIKSKSNLIFLIEDDDGNLFGCYVNATIDFYGWVQDPKLFVFSLRSNGRLNGMVKFDLEHPQTSFELVEKNHGCLFDIGRNFTNYICVWKGYAKNKSCFQQDINTYGGIQNPLSGKQEFTPTRIMAFQLI